MLVDGIKEDFSFSVPLCGPAEDISRGMDLVDGDVLVIESPDVDDVGSGFNVEQEDAND